MACPPPSKPVITVSATQEASEAATAASAAPPPACKISIPAPTVAGCPAAIEAVTRYARRARRCRRSRPAPVWRGTGDRRRSRQRAGRRRSPPRSGGRSRARPRPRCHRRPDPLVAPELADTVGGDHRFAVVQKADREPRNAPALSRLRGPFRQLLRRNLLHQRAATLLRDRGLGRARSLARRAETAETHIQEEISASHQGSKTGDHRPARPQRGGHRLAPGADRALDTACERAHGAPESAPEGPLFAARPAQAGRPPPATPAIPAKARPRGVSRTDPGARPQKITEPNRGWKFERTRRGRVDSNLHLQERSGGTMSIATQGPTTLSVEIAGREITFETGKLAKQADGAVVVREGDTMVLATAQGKTEAREGADFFPLTVDVEERMYAAGKIPGGFFKREGRPTERAILTARMIDRPIRPLWPKGFRNEVQVICTVLSADLVTAHDILCINGASAALMLSPLPFLGPVGAVRIGLIDGELVVNPTLQENWSETSLDLIVVGTKDGLTMVEAGADEVPEDVLLGALELAHGEIRKLCDAQEDLRRQAGKAKWLDTKLTEEIESTHGHTIWERIQSVGLREAAAVVDELATELAGEITMDSTEEDIQRQTQVRASLNMLLEKQRLVAVEGPVREQFESDLRALTDAEQDSKELKSAKRHLLFEHIEESVELPFPVGPAP